MWKVTRKQQQLVEVHLLYKSGNEGPCHSRWLVNGFPLQQPRFNSRSGNVGFVVDKSGTGVGVLWVLQVPLPILIPSTAPHWTSNIWGWYKRPNGGWHTKWTQSHPTLRKESGYVIPLCMQPYGKEIPCKYVWMSHWHTNTIHMLKISPNNFQIMM
jgi:hypothetical protein